MVKNSTKKFGNYLKS